MEDPTAFEQDVNCLCRLLARVNNASFESDDDFYSTIDDTAGQLRGIALFKLQFFIPMAALCGLVKETSLRFADMIKHSDGFTGGSHAALESAGFQPHQFGYILLNLARKLVLHGANHWVRISAARVTENENEMTFSSLDRHSIIYFMMEKDTMCYARSSLGKGVGLTVASMHPHNLFIG